MTFEHHGLRHSSGGNKYSNIGTITTMDESLTLGETARRLGVSRRRVQAMVSAGILPAEKRGAQWFVPVSALRVAEHNRDPRPGRPLAVHTTWEHIRTLSAQGPLLAAGGELDAFRRRVRRRARHRAYYVHPGLLDELRHHQRVVLGGRDAAAAVGVPVDPGDLDVYLADSVAEAILAEAGARPAMGGNANVFVHLVADDEWPFEPGQRHTDSWVAWLDLEDREDRAATTLLDRVIGGRARA